MEEMKLSQRYSLTEAIRRWVALNVTDRHETICHGLDFIYLNRRWPHWKNKVLRNTSNTWKVSRKTPGEFPVSQYRLSVL